MTDPTAAARPGVLWWRNNQPAPPACRSSPSPTASSATFASGDILIYGTNGGDTVNVTADFVPNGSSTGSVDTTVGGRVATRCASEFGSYQVKVVENGLTPKWFPLSQVTGRVVFNGFGGDDRFENFSGLRTYANGMEDNDMLIGGWGNDVLIGGNGLDTLFGQAGNDEIYDQGTDFAPRHIEGG